MSLQRILYYGPYDISIPDGPGVNEYEFTKVLATREAWFIVEEPGKLVPHLPDKRTRFFKRKTRIGNVFVFLKNEWKIAQGAHRMVKDNDIDVVVARMGRFPLSLLFLSYMPGIRLAIKTSGRYWYNGDAGCFREFIWRKINEFISIHVLKRAFAVDAVSTEYCDRLKKFLHADRVILIHNAVNARSFVPEEKPRTMAPVLGYVGGMPSRRGARQLVELVVRLREDHPAVRAVIAGWDNDMEAIAEEAERKGVSRQCQFLKWVDYARLPSVVRSFDIGLSMVPTSEAETSGNSSQKVRQYLACGVPVISVPQGHAFLRDHKIGSLAKAEDIDAIEKAVRFWISELQKDRKAIVKRTRDYAVRKFSVEATFEQRLEFWKRKL